MDVKARPGEVIRGLRKLLSPGGTLLLLNDFGREPGFTRARAEAAGLTILRWGLDRTLAPGLTKLVDYEGTTNHALDRAGDLRAFVLRN